MMAKLDEALFLSWKPILTFISSFSSSSPNINEEQIISMLKMDKQISFLLVVHVQRIQNIPINHLWKNSSSPHAHQVMVRSLSSTPKIHINKEAWRDSEVRRDIDIVVRQATDAHETTTDVHETTTVDEGTEEPDLEEEDLIQELEDEIGEELSSSTTMPSTENLSTHETTSKKQKATTVTTSKKQKATTEKETSLTTTPCASCKKVADENKFLRQEIETFILSNTGNLRPAFPCDDWDGLTRTCYLDRNIGDTVTFVLAFHKKANPEIQWAQEFHLYQSKKKKKYIIDPENPLWNIVIGSRGHEMRISPITEIDIDFNYFSATIINYYAKIHKQRVAKGHLMGTATSNQSDAHNLGFVYPGETLMLNMKRVSLPPANMKFKWYLEKDGEYSSLPSNMRLSPSGGVLTVSELRKEQEGILACAVFTNMGFFATKQRFLIKEMNQTNNMLLYVPTRSGPKGRKKRSANSDNYIAQSKEDTEDSDVVEGIEDDYVTEINLSHDKRQVNEQPYDASQNVMPQNPNEQQYSPAQPQQQQYANQQQYSHPQNPNVQQYSPAEPQQPQNPAEQQYSPPQSPDAQQYSPPQAPAEQQYSPPQNPDAQQYSPPQAPAEQQYSPPQAPAEQQYSPPQAPAEQQYSPPQNPDAQQYSPPQAPAEQQYSPPQAPAEQQYSPPQAPAEQPYSPPQAPAEQQYSPPQAPAEQQYSPPQVPAEQQYSPPQAPDAQQYSPAQSPAEQQYSPAQSPAEQQYAQAQQQYAQALQEHARAQQQHAQAQQQQAQAQQQQAQAQQQQAQAQQQHAQAQSAAEQQYAQAQSPAAQQYSPAQSPAEQQYSPAQSPAEQQYAQAQSPAAQQYSPPQNLAEQQYALAQQQYAQALQQHAQAQQQHAQAQQQHAQSQQQHAQAQSAAAQQYSPPQSPAEQQYSPPQYAPPQTAQQQYAISAITSGQQYPVPQSANMQQPQSENQYQYANIQIQPQAASPAEPILYQQQVPTPGEPPKPAEYPAQIQDIQSQQEEKVADLNLPLKEEQPNQPGKETSISKTEKHLTEKLLSLTKGKIRPKLKQKKEEIILELERKPVVSLLQKAQDRLAKMIANCTSDQHCAADASCVQHNSKKAGFCRCSTGFQGNGIFCWEEIKVRNLFSKNQRTENDPRGFLIEETTEATTEGKFLFRRHANG
ncbi:putative surface-exposed virulence protein like [Argiope bruennichi]|uniref:Putative surface-exposed virulence protein like n=1 Tax=Argiope bruennichi TaxID=94029 RepID=A0A8T0FAM7_ARGBR|nr:putative surface-exposed virulence protein like [Argiope bruennichi]